MYKDNLLISASQLLNAIFCGSPDEMLCSRLWRLHLEGIGLASVAVKIVDTIFSGMKTIAKKHTSINYHATPNALNDSVHKLVFSV